MERKAVSTFLWILILIGIILICTGAVLLNVVREEGGEGEIALIASGVVIVCGTLFASGFFLKDEGEFVRLGMIIGGAVILGLAISTI